MPSTDAKNVNASPSTSEPSNPNEVTSSSSTYWVWSIATGGSLISMTLNYTEAWLEYNSPSNAWYTNKSVPLKPESGV